MNAPGAHGASPAGQWPVNECVAVFGSGLTRGDDGILHGSGSKDVSYPTDGNENCFSVEEDSFWFRHRNECIVSVVKNFPPLNREFIFDIGGGNGYVSKGLSDAGFDVVLVEPGTQGALNARRRGLTNVICATLESASFHPRSMAAIGLFDVVEHIEDDLAFLRSIRELLKDGGRLYATVPAYSMLWSSEDEKAGHFRRYSLGEICTLLVSAGLNVEFSSYIFKYLPVPIFLLRALPHRFGMSRSTDAQRDRIGDHRPGSGVLSRLLEAMLKRELESLAMNRPIRFGGSCLVVASVPGRENSRV